jgi:hypothetical protein
MAYLLQTWYLLSRVKLHIACTSGQGRIAKPQNLAAESRDRCFAAALQLIELQCSVITAEIETTTKSRKPIGSGSGTWYFEGCFSLLEASVTIMTIMTHRPFAEREQQVDRLLDRSLEVFKRIASYERGKRGTIARMSVEVLGVLRNQTLPAELLRGMGLAEHGLAAQCADKAEAYSLDKSVTPCGGFRMECE